MYSTRVLLVSIYFNLFILHNNSFDDQGTEKKTFFYVSTLKLKTFLQLHIQEIYILLS